MIKIDNKIEFINKLIIDNNNNPIGNREFDTGDVSDGFHTFNDLYYQRFMLFNFICKLNRDVVWKSKLHADGTMYDNYFIVGVDTPQGPYTYHYHMDHWNDFDTDRVLDKAPEWDGHTVNDVTRLHSLITKGVASSKAVNIKLELPDDYNYSFQPHQLRVIDEYNSLYDKALALGEFIANSKFESIVGKSEAIRLTKQHKVMIDYLSILVDRVNNFTH